MKKTALILQILMVLILASASFAYANEDQTDALIKQVVKVVPKGAELIAREANDSSAFVAYTQGVKNYQFTLSGDMNPQIKDAKEFKYKGKKAFYFQPGMEDTGGLMIILSAEKSIVIIYSSGFSNDEEVNQKTMTQMADQMDLGSL
ncbi:hypothetical protein SAMN05660337_2999 [Maridesulfovibrio ferrireducens]|uniref:DUF4252 domain-containing protein n=1 Tax=Maridesulfovibrio ferrireducens TaxID=246191 RepID=A0A1G9KAR4_9BACT|nr:hypothetical protein [Maridesulfovibrio ferrireducens]SDL46524.1 hypothetical protein SAMN05660337_2999 [Maridesulfovibrio ferrireducens]